MIGWILGYVIVSLAITFSFYIGRDISRKYKKLIDSINHLQCHQKNTYVAIRYNHYLNVGILRGDAIKMAVEDWQEFESELIENFGMKMLKGEK